MSSNSDSLVQHYVSKATKSVFFQGEKIRGSFASELEHYRSRVAWRRMIYRACGSLVIILSIALPILAAFGKPPINKDLWVSIMAGVIALLTGVNSFFRFDVAWKGATETLLTLERLRNDWALAIAKAEVQPDAKEGLKLAIAATEQFQKASHDLVEAETRGLDRKSTRLNSSHL